MFWRHFEKQSQARTKEKPDPRQVVETTSVEPETPIQQYRQTLEVRKQGVRSIVESLMGHRLTPSEFVHLVVDAFPRFRERESSEVALRKEETRQAYLFLDYLQSIATKRVRLIPFGVITANILNTIGFIGDTVSKPEIYDRNKELWWGRTVNRPDRAEHHEVKDRALNSSHATYVELYQLTEEAQQRLKEFNANNMFMIGMIFEQLRSLTQHRREKVEEVPEGKELTLPFAAIGKKEEYTITIHHGSTVKKVNVPARLLEPSAFRHFYVEIYPHLISEDGWTSATESPVRDQITASSRRGYTGAENIAEAKKRRSDMGDFTAADLNVSIVNSQEMTLDIQQSDYRSSTYGSAVPVSLTFGLDRGNGITHYSTKHAHAYTDGAYALEETKAVSERVFTQHIQPNYLIEKTVSRPKAVYREQTPYIAEHAIDRKKYTDRIDRLRNFFTDQEKVRLMFLIDPDLKKFFKHDSNIRQFNLDLNIQNLITLAVMTAMGHEDAHFLEGIRHPKDRKKVIGLAPAACVLPPDLAQEIRTGKIPKKKTRKQHTYDLLVSLSTLDTSRDLTKAGRGPAHILGSLLHREWLRRPVQNAGYIFDTKKTAMIIDTTMFSMLVRGDKPWQTGNEYLSLQGFTTAFADTYQEVVYGACDRKNPVNGRDEINITARGKKEGVKREELLSSTELYLHRILTDLEWYVFKVENVIAERKIRRATRNALVGK